MKTSMLISLKLCKCLMLKNVSFVILRLQMCIIFEQQKVVLNDVGNSRIDPEAIGINGIQKKNMLFAVLWELLIFFF